MWFDWMSQSEDIKANNPTVSFKDFPVWNEKPEPSPCFTLIYFSKATFSLFLWSIAVFVAFLKVTPIKRSLTQGMCISFDL